MSGLFLIPEYVFCETFLLSKPRRRAASRHARRRRAVARAIGPGRAQPRHRRNLSRASASAAPRRRPRRRTASLAPRGGGCRDAAPATTWWRAWTTWREARPSRRRARRRHLHDFAGPARGARRLRAARLHDVVWAGCGHDGGGDARRHVIDGLIGVAGIMIVLAPPRLRVVKVCGAPGISPGSPPPLLLRAETRAGGRMPPREMRPRRSSLPFRQVRVGTLDALRRARVVPAAAVDSAAHPC